MCRPERLLFAWTAEPEPSHRRPTTDQRATLQRTYARIAPWYDLLDLALEYRRYRALRSATFARTLQQVRILDCGAYGASFTRGTAEHVARAGLRIEERSFLHSDTIELIVARKL
jgi:hypothetical protein